MIMSPIVVTCLYKPISSHMDPFQTKFPSSKKQHNTPNLKYALAIPGNKFLIRWDFLSEASLSSNMLQNQLREPNVQTVVLFYLKDLLGSLQQSSQNCGPTGTLS